MRLASFCCARGLIPRGCKVLVAAPAPPTFADDELLPSFCQVTEQIPRFSVINDRSRRDVNNEVFSAPPGHL